MVVQISWDLAFNSLGLFPEVELLAYMVILVTFEERLAFSTVDAPFYISTSSNKVLISSHPY